MPTTPPRPKPGRTIVNKPDGGFVFIPAAALLCLWQGYRNGQLEFLDVRVALASCEAAQRVRLAGYARTAVDAALLCRLTAATDTRRVRAALRRLEQAGLSAEELSGPRPSVQPYVRLLASDTAAMVANHRRRVPVPRRMLTFMAKCSRPAVVAVTLAHLLRGMYFRGGQCVGGGTCKASWIALVFALDLRTVKGARSAIVALGWITLEPTPQHLLNRYGPRFLIDMRWAAPDARQRPPPARENAPRTPPPEKDRNLSLRRSGNQNRPASGALTVAPSMADVTVPDLRNNARLEALYRDSLRRGMVRESESTRLAFFAAAEHALARGQRNVPGLFVAVVKRGLWSHITQEEEDRARRSLARLDFGADSLSLGRQTAEAFGASPKRVT
ncbi:MAG: hypothetical protein L6Q35_16005 [Phycisphaerales bacterium]|nr:hypothetical protein [Phycisphaerales bacterium]